MEGSKVKEVLLNQTVTTDGATSSKSDVERFHDAVVVYKWTDLGSLAGVLKLQMNAGDPADSTDWLDIPGASATLTGSGSGFFEFEKLSYNWIRAVVTVSAGSATVSTYVSAKQLAGE